MTPVNSGAIRAVGHDPSNGTLMIQFASGETYHYAGVPRHVHDALLTADSPGKHFHANIRGQYPHEKKS